MVFSGQTDVVTLWLVLPGHLTQGLVSVVVLVMCSVITLGVGHRVIEPELLEVLLAELVFAETLDFSDSVPVRAPEINGLVFAEELDFSDSVLVRAPELVVPLRKGAELEVCMESDPDWEDED